MENLQKLYIFSFYGSQCAVIATSEKEARDMAAANKKFIDGYTVYEFFIVPGVVYYIEE